MDSAKYRNKAVQALRLAKGLGPGEAADALRALAAIYGERADALDVQPEKKGE